MSDERCTYTIMYVCGQSRDDHTDLHEFGTKPNEVMALRWQLETAGAMGKGLFEKNEELRERCAKLTQRARDAEEALVTAREDVLREVLGAVTRERDRLQREINGTTEWTELRKHLAASDQEVGRIINIIRSLSTEGGEE